jgi:hypothetical protein
MNQRPESGKSGEGEPALGRIPNLRVVGSKLTLLGHALSIRGESETKFGDCPPQRRQTGEAVPTGVTPGGSVTSAPTKSAAQSKVWKKLV